jgi:hypothetical protein
VFPATLEMATIGIIIGVALGVPMGVIAASRQGSLTDQAIRVVGLLGYSSTGVLAGADRAAPVLRPASAGWQVPAGWTSSMTGWCRR